MKKFQVNQLLCKLINIQYEITEIIDLLQNELKPINKLIRMQHEIEEIIDFLQKLERSGGNGNE